ncbi:MAG TPA: condensation domain-containing protein, partial [Micromonosporaceae bacterium]|nr:condensation domain-containing protein [Micromonosporaceae bacterium]
LPLRADLSGDPTYRELLAATRETLLDALDHQDITFGRMVTALNTPLDLGRAQIFQVLFVFDEFDGDGGVPLPGLRIEEFPLAIPKTLHDVMLYARPIPDGLHTRFVYDSGLFTEATMASIAQRYEDLLRAAVDHPDHPLSSLGR